MLIIFIKHEKPKKIATAETFSKMNLISGSRLFINFENGKTLILYYLYFMSSRKLNSTISFNILVNLSNNLTSKYPHLRIVYATAACLSKAALFIRCFLLLSKCFILCCCFSIHYSSTLSPISCEIFA